MVHRTMETKSDAAFLDAHIVGNHRIARGAADTLADPIDKAGAEHRQRAFQRSGGAKQRRAIEHVLDPEPEACSVAECVLDHGSEVRHTEHHVAHPFAFQPLQLVLGERAPADVDQRFWDAGRDRAEARGQPAGKDGHRHAHANSTFVPSKSNRNRISSRPAAAIAERKRR